MKTRLLISLIILLGLSSMAQKRAMTIEDSKSWNGIRNKAISSNGQYVSYAINPHKGDGNLYLYNDVTKLTAKYERGKSAKLGFDNNLLIFKIAPQADSLRQKKLDKVKKDKLPKDSLGIYFFVQDSVLKVEKVQSYCLPEKNSQWLAYIFDYVEPKDTTTLETDSLQVDSLLNDSLKIENVKHDSLKVDSLKLIELKTDSLKAEKKTYTQEGKRLTIINTANLESYIFDNVAAVTCSENGNSFAFLREIKDSLDTAKIFIFDTRKAKESLVFEKVGTVKKVQLDRLGAQMTFQFTNDTTDVKKQTLWYFNTKDKEAKMLIDTVSTDFPKNWGYSENGKTYFSDSGARLYFGIAEHAEEEPKDTLLSEEKVRLDIWSWNDKRIQPHQKSDLKDDLSKTLLTYYDIKSKKFIQIEEEFIDSRARRDIDPTYFLGRSYDAYIKMLTWDVEFPSDFYIIDAKTGQKRLLAQEKKWSTRISPSGLYTLIWDKVEEEWLIANNKTLKISPLSRGIKDEFYQAKHDMPTLKGSSGYIGFSEGEKFVYINSQYDIWKFDTQAKKTALNITKGEGKKNLTTFDIKHLDRDAIYLPKSKWLLHAFNHKTMAEAYLNLDLETLERTVLIEDNKSLYSPTKAKNAEKIIWANSDFKHYPELRISGMDFKDSKILTEANPQQKDINWGKISMTEWTAFDGDTLKGLLILPEDFDPMKKYPVIVYFYEKYSENLNRYWAPRPSHSTINFSFYASNGYIVFVPDINYGTGLPGKDAYNAIVSGTQHISNLPFVNKNKIGLQGQSWGGYQVAYLVTQTNLYACGMAGAPVSNMTSAYGGVRWESGMSRMFQYEHTQSRIGGTLWNKRDKYIENSPVFFADRVETPLLIMHNDGDGAVPWYQGIEYYMALRRLNKTAWLLNYNGDGHNLMKWPNRVDLTIRMFGFFEHYLKDKAMPEWMEKGLPAVKKGKELRY